jgi:hypothetical protein
VRLSVDYILGCDHYFWNWDARETKTLGGYLSRAGCDHAPLPFWDRADEVDGAGHDGDGVTISGFALFQFAHFRLRIEMRSNGTNDFDGAHTMSDSDHLFFINATESGPDAPLAADGAGGIDENSIDVEEDGGAAKSGHAFF